jgi:hypothetical protein
VGYCMSWPNLNVIVRVVGLIVVLVCRYLISNSIIIVKVLCCVYLDAGEVIGICILA